jgi:hypothetical protein
MKDCQIYCCFLLFGPNLQQLNGVQYGPTNGMPFFFLQTIQESKKCNKSEIFVIACSSSATIKTY